MTAVGNENNDRALQILASAFDSIPSTLWIVKNDEHIHKRVLALSQFCLSVALQKNGAFISSDEKGVALIFRNGIKQTPLKWLVDYFRLGNECIGWRKAWSIIQREKTIVSKRLKIEHLYFWMLGVEDHSNGLNTIIEIRDFVFAYSRQLKLPILAETTVEKNLTLYKRYGFSVYDRWETGVDGINIWFIQRSFDP
jgi:hypothetical protein